MDCRYIQMRIFYRRMYTLRKKKIISFGDQGEYAYIVAVRTYIKKSYPCGIKKIFEHILLT